MKPAAGLQSASRARVFVILAMAASLGLAACGGANAATIEAADSGAGAAPLSSEDGSQPDSAAGADAITQPRALILPAGTVVDRQGEVEVAITPLGDLSAQSGSLVFEVAMNTHTIELGMDLASRASLTTDNGLTLPAQHWSGGGGHHVTGLLEFPLPQDADGERLATASRWTLTLREVDAPERIFEWVRP